MDENREAKSQKTRKRAVLIVCVIVLSVLLFGVGLAMIVLRTKSPVPGGVAQRVNFSVYYPDPNALPAGFVLNQKSFQYVSGRGVLYAVDYGSNKRLIFTVQEKPSDGELANFNKLYLPINRKVLTQVGTATEGAIGKQAVVSLPVDADKVWIIMTGPPDIYGTNSLAQVLKAIKK